MSRTVLGAAAPVFDITPPRRGARSLMAAALLLLAVFLFLCLSTSRTRPSLIGSAGVFIDFLLTFVLGRISAFGAPILIALIAVGLARLLRVGQILRRAIPFVICCLTLSCMIRLWLGEAQGTTQADETAFAWSGLFAAFIIHEKGLGLPNLVGQAGAWMILGSVMFVSAAVLTDFFFLARLSRFAPAWLGRWRESRQLKSARRLDFPHSDPDVVLCLTQQTRDMDQALQITPPWIGEEGGPAATAGGAEPPAGAGPEIERPGPVAAVQTDLFREPIGGEVPGRAKSPRARKDETAASGAETEQEELDLFAEYQLPSVSLMSPPPPDLPKTSNEELQRQATLLEQKLKDFKIEARVVKITQGPVITRFEIKPAAGVRVSAIANLERDLAMALAAVSVRIQAPIPGKDTVGIEAPNSRSTPVFLREVMESDEFQQTRMRLPFCLGKTIAGQPMVVDLADMPHLLIAGTTGSGKSVCLNAIICSFLMRYTPDELKFIMIDPKRVELSVYHDIPHLLAPVVSDPRKAAGALNWMVDQMQERYKQLAELKVRNIDGYNALFDPRNPDPKLLGRNLEPMPRVVLVIDELADLMMIARNEVEEAIIRLAQLARAVGIHLILATQRPSVNVITGIIKANFPARIAFQVSSVVDSRTILDYKGAETLLGKGDMLYMSVKSPRPERMQGCFVSDKEVENLAEFVRSQGPAFYVMKDFKDTSEKKKDNGRPPSSAASRDGSEWEVRGPMTREDGQPMEASEIFSEYLKDEVFRAATKLVLANNKASVSLIQRRLKVGFARSGRLMDMMQEAGLVGEHKGSKPRDILVDPAEYLMAIGQYENEELGGEDAAGDAED